MEWKDELIRLYLSISESKNINNYLSALRRSNNYCPRFTDEETMTLYLFGLLKKHRTVKDIHRFAREHLQSWFPMLPSYQAFSKRLNLLAGAFSILSAECIESASEMTTCCTESILDSMPIILAGRGRSEEALVAKEYCDKSYCGSKNLYYYGLKLHLLSFVRPGGLPVPEFCWFSFATENDLTAARPVFERLYNRKIYADKGYADAELKRRMYTEQNCMLLTPIKKGKGQLVLDAADTLYSRAVSRIRQPIESFFNWLNECTGIQNGTKVRSAKGLLAHVWGRLAAGFVLFVFRLKS